MNLSDDQKLETFLKENRPLHPRHSETESKKIWAHLRHEIRQPFFQNFAVRKSFATGLTALAGVSLMFAMLYQKPHTESLPARDSSKHELALIEESMDLTFLENGELYEVSDLLSLSK